MPGPGTAVPEEPTVGPSSGVLGAVFNGTTTPGLAITTAQRLQDAGYEIADVDVTPEPVERTAVYYRPGAQAAADELAAAFFEGEDVLPATAEVESLTNSSVVVSLGGDYEA